MCFQFWIWCHLSLGSDVRIVESGMPWAERPSLSPLLPANIPACWPLKLNFHLKYFSFKESKTTEDLKKKSYYQNTGEVKNYQLCSSSYIKMLSFSSDIKYKKYYSHYLSPEKECFAWFQITRQIKIFEETLIIYIWWCWHLFHGF